MLPPFSFTTIDKDLQQISQSPYSKRIALVG